MGKDFNHGFALLVGVNENEVSRLELPLVARDVESLHRVFTHPDRCAYLPENVRTLTGKDASRASILNGLGWLRERILADASGNTTAVFYYSGHGWRDESADPPAYYLIPYDLREDKLHSSAIRAQQLSDVLSSLKPRRLLVILDCCHAGGIEVKELSTAMAGFTELAFEPAQLVGVGIGSSPASKDLEDLAQGDGRAVLSSSKGEQRSYTRQDGSMSIFTYHLIEALSGHARPHEGAAEVLVSDVMSYVSRQVPRTALTETGFLQEPDYRVSGNFPIALLLGGKGLAVNQVPPEPASLFEGTDFRQVGGDITTGVKIEARVGDVGSGTIIGIGTNISQRLENVLPIPLDSNQKELEAMLEGLGRKLEALDLPQRQRSDAAYNLEQVREELTKKSGPLDVRRLRVTVDWLCQYAPGLKALLAGLFAHPFVSRIFSESGETETEWLKERFQGGSHV